MMHVLSRSRMACAGLVAGAALALQATPGFGAVVFSDDFNGYANVTELRAAWTKADVTTPNNSDVNLVTTFDVDNNTTGTAGLGTGVADQALASNAMSLGNGVWYHTLDSAINGDWTLSTKMIHSAYTRSGGIGLMNGAGTQGYVLRWSSARVDQESGGGSITMRRFDLPAEWDNWDFLTNASSTQMAGGTPVSGSISSGHPAAGFAVTALDAVDPTLSSAATYNPTWLGFADILIQYTVATGTITVSVNGNQLLSVVDATPFTSFERVYVRGNSSTYFDDIVVEAVPEPATLGLLSVGAMGLLVRRRRSV